MDVSLSDLLTCPRCGPGFGLVLLPYEAEDRRVRSGVLGCANCRERFPVEDGVADLRVEGGVEMEAPAGDSSTGEQAADASVADAPVADAPVGGDGDPAVRLAGLMGLAEARGTVLVAGSAAAHAAALSELVQGVEVVAVESSPGGGGRAEAAGGDPDGGVGVSWLRVTTALPFRTGSLRGVALTGRGVALLDEGARVLGREGRLVVTPAPADARSRLEAAGLAVVAEEEGTVVAARSG